MKYLAVMDIPYRYHIYKVEEEENNRCNCVYIGTTCLLHSELRNFPFPNEIGTNHSKNVLLGRNRIYKEEITLEDLIKLQ